MASAHGLALVPPIHYLTTTSPVHGIDWSQETPSEQQDEKDTAENVSDQDRMSAARLDNLSLSAPHDMVPLEVSLRVMEHGDPL